MKNKLLKLTIAFLLMAICLSFISGCGSQKKSEKKSFTIEQLESNLQSSYSDLVFSVNDTDDKISFSYEDDDIEVNGTANKSNIVQTVVVVKKDVDRTKITNRSVMEDIIYRVSNDASSLTLSDVKAGMCYILIVNLYKVACGEYNFPATFLDALCNQETLTAGDWEISINIYGNSLEIEMH